MANLTKPKSLTKLNELLDANHNQFDITFKSFLANHMVHALCSMVYCGASSDQLQSYFDWYSEKLDPLKEPQFRITKETWTDYLKQASHYSEYLQFFEIEIKELGMIETLNKYLPKLIPGLAGAALHPLIHIGYAVEFQLPQVLAEGLAYACTYYLPIGELIDKLPTPSEYKSISEIIRETSKLDASQWKDERSPFAKLEMVEQNFGHQIISLVSQWQLNVDEVTLHQSLNELTKESIYIYGDSTHNNRFDFFLLHQVTGNHAVRIILPLLPPEQKIRLLRINLATLIIFFLVQSAPSLDRDRVLNYESDIFQEVQDWNQLLEMTTHHRDEHLMKVIRNIYQFDVEQASNDDHTYYFKLAIMTWDSQREEGKWIYVGRDHQDT